MQAVGIGAVHINVIGICGRDRSTDLHIDLLKDKTK